MKAPFLTKWFLHADQWRDFTFDSVQTWKEQTQQFPDKEYGILEWQANEFAGLILVPPEELTDEVERLKLTLNASGYSHEAFDSETLAASMAVPIARTFLVSTEVAQRRISADQLL